MIPTISIKEATECLGFKDQRTTLKFCEQHGIEIFSHNGRKKHLIRSQFEYIKTKRLIEYLKARYQEKWIEAFQAYSSENILNVVQVEEAKGFEKWPSTIKKEKEPTGQSARKFLSDLQSFLTEL